MLEGYDTYHTGRIEFENIEEKFAMEEVMSNPLDNAKELDVPITDEHIPPPPEDWVKYANNVNREEIHFIYNEKTNEFMDFKFK